MAKKDHGLMLWLQVFWANAQPKAAKIWRKASRCWWVILIGCGYFWMACPSPSWLETLRPPQGQERLQVRWMRTTFYQAYLEEKRTLDGEDRLRRLIRKFPQLALQTYRYNEKAVEERRLTGQPMRNLETFYLLMNQLIRETIAIPKQVSTSSD